VLVARLDPLRAIYHPWLSEVRPVRLRIGPLRAMDILTDAELGPLPTPELGELPQVPARLARCGRVIGVGSSADTAVLDATLGALRAQLPAGTAVGIGHIQALGYALRMMVRHGAEGEPVPEREWASDPTARLWWKALTLRFAVPVTLAVRRIAPRVVRAEIQSSQGLLAWAVETTAADAVAFAALAAAGRVQAGATGVAHLNAAIPASLMDSHPQRDWRWPIEAAENEPALQADLAALAGVNPRRVSLDATLESTGVVAFEVGDR
jgi:hypothetical protein